MKSLQLGLFNSFNHNRINGKGKDNSWCKHRENDFKFIQRSDFIGKTNGNCQLQRLLSKVSCRGLAKWIKSAFIKDNLQKHLKSYQLLIKIISKGLSKIHIFSNYFSKISNKFILKLNWNGSNFKSDNKKQLFIVSFHRKRYHKTKWSIVLAVVSIGCHISWL